MKYKICPDCGAHIDFGERCDCTKKDVPCAANTEDINDRMAITDALSMVIVAEQSTSVNCREVNYRCS